MVRLREHMRNHLADLALVNPTDNVLRFPESPCLATEEGAEAVDLVFQAADMIRGIEDRAAAIATRARNLIEDAIQKLLLAETRNQELETEQRVAEARINEANLRIRETEDELNRAKLRIAAVESQLSAAELYARTAERRACEAKDALLGIEDAVRTQLLRRKKGTAHQFDGGLSSSERRWARFG
jgi:chromosome segregation ATPase